MSFVWLIIYELMYINKVSHRYHQEASTTKKLLIVLNNIVDSTLPGLQVNNCLLQSFS